ncbi:trypsin-like peptidase domain-containing protein [Advenella sp. WQ 585]|uniref:Trypsin-like peptidase domain-containing protein n=1 Tax=Advenella mandrilli TaxID=2800330 RepID=A0ABS1EGW1_9BURK|nr:trypsin-like peptidase domain-containing protein [Advenella mandrilli]MBK1782266.1 trypsin-like peptidase domain-containing protein [Advenella mandrilli]
MHRYWLIFSQTVTVFLAILFTVTTLRPDWLDFKKQAAIPASVPTATAKIEPAEPAKETETNSEKTKEPEQLITIITSYAGAVKVAAPSVVNIYTSKNIESPFKNLPDVPALRPFIQEQKENMQMLNNTTSLGSGVIASADGYILTNYHVVEAADSIEIALTDGRKTNARLIGADPDTDLAVLKIDLPDLVPIHPDNKQQLSVGDVVLAIGNPFGVGQTTTMGIISALGRTGLGINTYENFIQTDAAINPGNSGGALINVNGDLIGINTAIYSESEAGGSLGIGFATPAHTALKIMQEIIETGTVSRGWLGIEPQDITSDLAKAFNLDSTKGIIIASLVPNGPAGQAGLLVGDILLGMNDKEIIDTDQMLNEIAGFPPKSQMKFKILRSGKSQDVTVTLGQRPGITSKK